MYVPVATFLLVLGLSSWLVKISKDDQPESAGGKLSPTIELPGPDSASSSTLLVLGNSQTFSIPDAAPGDLATPQWLQAFLTQRQSNAVQVQLGSLGGITAEEMLVRAVQWESTQQRPRQLLISVQPSELSQVALRAELERAVQRKHLQQSFADLMQQNPDLTLIQPELKHLTQVREDPKLSWPEALENHLQQRAASALPLFEHRDDALSLGYLVFIRERNRVAGVDTLNRKPLQPASYRASLQFLTLILRSARDRGIPIYIYMAPVRAQGESIYSDSDVEQMTVDLRALATRYGAQFADYRQLFAPKYWTNYPDTAHNRVENIVGQPDPAHFREAAHKLLAQEIDRAWGDLIINRAEADSKSASLNHN